MKFSAAAIFLAASGSVSAVAIRARDEQSDLQRDYDIETDVLKDRGLCRVYQGADPEYSKFTDLCGPKCGDARAIVDETNEAYSVTCAVTGTTTQPTFTDPEDETYKLGQCFCNLPIINWVGENFVAALPALGQVTCAVWKEASKEAASILSGASGVGSAKTSVQALIKVAKLLNKVGKGASEYEDYVREHLEAGDACDFDIGQLFEDAVGLSDDAIANVNGS